VAEQAPPFGPIEPEIPTRALAGLGRPFLLADALRLI